MHGHGILYNSGTGADGGIWGGNGANSGNYGAVNGIVGFASTANFGGG